MEQNRRYIVKILVFLLLVIVVNLGLTAMYNRWMYYFRLCRYQDEQFAEYSGKLTYLMIGNSHNIVDPDTLGNSFSYVTPRELYPQTYYRLKSILERSPKKPAYVLLSIDPVNFTPKAETDLTFDGYWKKYLDYGEMYRLSGDRTYLLNWAVGRFFSYVGNFKFIYNSVPFIWYDYKKIRKGYMPRRDFKTFAMEKNRDALGLERATAYLSGYNHQSVIGSSRYYAMILDLCHQHHVIPVLLRMPLSDEYKKHAFAMVDYSSLDRQIIELTKRHCSNYRLFDFRDEFSGRPMYFFNADHVNPTGAGIISRKIRDELLKEAGPTPAK